MKLYKYINILSNITEAIITKFVDNYYQIWYMEMIIYDGLELNINENEWHGGGRSEIKIYFILLHSRVASGASPDN